MFDSFKILKDFKNNIKKCNCITDIGTPQNSASYGVESYRTTANIPILILTKRL